MNKKPTPKKPDPEAIRELDLDELDKAAGGANNWELPIMPEVPPAPGGDWETPIMP